MPIDYDPLKEGDALTAASLNTRLDGARAGVNDLAPDDFERGAFRKEHLPSIIPATNAGTIFEDGLSKLGPTLAEAVADPQIYQSKINSNSITGNYQLFGGVANGGSALLPAPYGPPNALTDVGWRILSFTVTGAPGSAPHGAAEINLGVGGAGITLSSGAGYRGLLVKASCNLIGQDSPLKMIPYLDGFVTYTAAGTPVTLSQDQITHQEDWRQCVLIGIGYEDDGGRHVIERSIRWYSICNSSGGSIETFTFVDHSDIDHQNNNIKSVFCVVASGVMTIAGVLPGTTSCDPQIGPYNIDVLPVRSGELDSIF